ncbi:hypothetical protein GGX14DRAFT_565397 [Mycena pura]|uniref:Uncharacterized protein n=1 Tax=Mycena pura TaxID=153505 RepID=A0AAD6VID4_9AGAR|nr:hypothetical protein GGX14DRAFT_565397 [Mycena pura]
MASRRKSSWSNSTESGHSGPSLDTLAAAAVLYAVPNKENIPPRPRKIKLKLGLKPPSETILEDNQEAEASRRSRKRTSSEFEDEQTYVPNETQDVVSLASNSPVSKHRRHSTASEDELNDDPDANEDLAMEDDDPELPAPHQLLAEVTSRKPKGKGDRMSSEEPEPDAPVNSKSHPRPASSRVRSKTTEKGKRGKKKEKTPPPTPTVMKFVAPTIVQNSIATSNLSIPFNSSYTEAEKLLFDHIGCADVAIKPTFQYKLNVRAAPMLLTADGWKDFRGAVEERFVKDKGEKVTPIAISLLPDKYMESLVDTIRKQANYGKRKKAKLLDLNAPVPTPASEFRSHRHAGADDDDDEIDEYGADDRGGGTDLMHEERRWWEALEKEYKGRCRSCGRNVWCKVGPDGECISIPMSHISPWALHLVRLFFYFLLLLFDPFLQAKKTHGVTLQVPPRDAMFDLYRASAPNSKARSANKTAPAPSAPAPSSLMLEPAVMAMMEQNRLLLSAVLQQRTADPAPAPAPTAPPTAHAVLPLDTLTPRAANEPIEAFIADLHALHPQRHLDQLLLRMQAEDIVDVGDIQRLGAAYLELEVGMSRATALFLVAITEGRRLVPGEPIVSFIAGLHALNPMRNVDLLLPELQAEAVVDVGDLHRLGAEYLMDKIGARRPTALWLIQTAESRYPALLS